MFLETLLRNSGSPLTSVTYIIIKCIYINSYVAYQDNTGVTAWPN